MIAGGTRTLRGRLRTRLRGLLSGEDARSRRLRVEAEPAFRTRYANPYNARLYTAMTAEGVLVRDLSWARLLLAKVDVVHLHWPDLTFLSGVRRYRIVARLVFFFAFLRVARLRGTRLIWTAHNVTSHEERGTPFLRNWYRRLLTENLDAIVCLSEEGVTAMRRSYPELAAVPAFVTPHGHYRQDYDFSASRAEARAELGLDPDARLVVSVGQIRPYKNVPTLIERFRDREDDGTLLAIAGNPARGPLRGVIEEAAAGDERIRLELSFLSDERMALWLRASDLVVLPYSAIQNSGSAILAVSADRPVLVPDLGAMHELAALVGPDWVRLYDGAFDTAALDGALAWLDERTVADDASADLSALEWDAIARATIAVYRDVLRAPRPR
ncbi:glycosyltransferase family 4 protein [Rathayibacter sp. VKM Ac-2857]|uniref:glycosyltransferase family 4 protein n=1 Tax=Rathayibacter sp. VKM Ac-2857 TaxID=2739020 RepID=UPI001564C511|nr:glycosyltransferase family 4 protein [Rathayibacter sp. VKM Ac-2857]NQX15654.1 glycosyltransferase family 4 protein [Rathayibacter sp. VKM Ac-2857]